MTHKHGGCAPALQVIIIAFGFVAACLSAYAINYDHAWNQELDGIRSVFNKIEFELLKRDEYGLEITFVLVLCVCTILVLVHLAISLKRRGTDDLYGAKSSKVFHIVILVANLVAAALMLISVGNYDSNYSAVEALDNRTYEYHFMSNDEDVILKSPHSIFYYCHLGRGRLMRPNELKGIRMRKSETKICQPLGAKLLAALLAVYISILCYCIQWFITVGDRYLDGTTLAMLFDLYGDAEEFKRDHPHHPNPEDEVRAFRQQHKFRKMKDVEEVSDAVFEAEYDLAVVRTASQEELSDEGEGETSTPSAPTPAPVREASIRSTQPRTTRRAVIRSGSTTK